MELLAKISLYWGTIKDLNKFSRRVGVDVASTVVGASATFTSNGLSPSSLPVCSMYHRQLRKLPILWRRLALQIKQTFSAADGALAWIVSQGLLVVNAFDRNEVLAEVGQQWVRLHLSQLLV